MWRKSIIYRKIKLAIQTLKKNLFACDSILRPAILEITAMCSMFLHTSLVDTSQHEKVPLFYFVEVQVSFIDAQFLQIFFSVKF